MGPLVLHYSAEGSYVSELGRPGQGPGEIGGPVAFAVGAGAVAVHQLRSPVVTIFDPGALSFRHSVRLPGAVWSLAAAHDGAWVAAFQYGGHDIHLLDSGGRIQRSLGATTGTGELGSLVRYVAEGEDGVAWSATMSGRVEVFSRTGMSLAPSLQIADLGLGAPLPERVRPGARMPSVVTAVTWDPQGFLWLFVSTADERGARAGGARPSPEDLLDTAVFLVTLQNGRLSAHPAGRFDTLVRPLGGGWAYDLITLPSGDRKVRVGRLRTEPG